MNTISKARKESSNFNAVKLNISEFFSFTSNNRGKLVIEARKNKMSNVNMNKGDFAFRFAVVIANSAGCSFIH